MSYPNIIYEVIYEKNIGTIYIINTSRRILYIYINGSPNQKGCTYTALNEISSTLNNEGIETEIYYIGKEPVAPCRACRACGKIGRCVINDKVNDFVCTEF